MANDLNEEEAVVIGATTTFLGLWQPCLGIIIIEAPIMKLGFLKSRVSLMSIEMSIGRIISIVFCIVGILITLIRFE